MHSDPPVMDRRGPKQGAEREGGMNMSRALLPFLLCIMIFILPGCWDRKEVNDIALIMAAGIDKKTDETLELSVLVFIPRAGGQQQMGESGGGGGTQTLVRSAEGKNIADAMSMLQKILPRRVFWGHNEVFIIDEELARDGVTHLIDFMMRHPMVRERTQIYVSKEKTKEVLGLNPPLEQDLSRVLTELGALKIGMEVTAKDLAQMIISDAEAASVPRIEMLPPQPGKEKTESIAYISGTAIFKKGKMVGSIDDAMTRGVLWLRNEIELAVVTVEPEGSTGDISMQLLRARSELIPKIENGKWKMTLKAETEDDIIQNSTNLNLMNPKTIKMLERELEKEIEQRVYLALQQVQKDMKADIFGFADAFHRAYPEKWKTEKKSWDDIFPNVEVTVEAKAKIHRPGMTATPILPEDEVKK
jgi:spore germination protein KC